MPPTTLPDEKPIEELSPELTNAVNMFFDNSLPIEGSSVVVAQTEQKKDPASESTSYRQEIPEIHLSAFSHSGNTLDDKKNFLHESEIRVEQAIHELETDVHERLLKLKDLKNKIESEMTRIKELQETKGHIEEQVLRISELQAKLSITESEIQKIGDFI